MSNTNTKTKIYIIMGVLFIIFGCVILFSITFAIKDSNSTITLMHGTISVVNYMGLSFFSIAFIWFIFTRYEEISTIKKLLSFIFISCVITYICSSNSTIALLMIGEISVIELFVLMFSAVLTLGLGIYWLFIKKGRF